MAPHAESGKEHAMKKYLLLLLLLSLVPLLFTGCGRDSQAANSLEQIYAEEGIPVRTRELKPSVFQTWRTYNADLTGIEESSAHSMVLDKVEKLYVKVGDYVQKDQVVLSFPKDTPTARYHQAQVAYENARVSYERIKNLFESGGVSRQELDNAKTAYDVAAADWSAASQTIEVRAPISGYITKLDVMESDNVDHGDELFTISRTERLKAKVWAAESEIMNMRRGLAATAEWNGIVLKGNVVQVDMALNQDMKAFGVVVEFENPGSRMPLGVTAEVRVSTYQNPDALVVERKDLVSEGGEQFAYVAAGGAAEKRRIVQGRQQGLDVEVVEGLRAGEDLIVEGQMLLRDGAKIKVVQ
jgi:membrane fusion protein (multidrug efflux system)